MSASLAVTERRLHVALFQSGIQSGYQFSRNTDGTASVTGLKVFRSGTFKDSWGDSHTWDAIHMQQMTFHFGMLRDSGILPNVPVRDGHPGIFGSGGEVVGYIDSLEASLDVNPTDGQEYTYLLSNFTFTEPDAAAKFERGTFRARSAEIGMYETNAGATYFPVFMGFAFVDIPAVEGLYENQKTHRQFTILNEGTRAVADGPNNGGQGAQAQPGAPQAQTTGAAGAPVPNAPQSGETPAGTSQPTNGPGSQATAATQQAEAAAQQHSNSVHANQGSFSFSINGQPTTDFGAVQRHISTLEQFERETREQARRNYVSGLAAGPSARILEPQVESLTNLALGMTDEQFGQFRAAYDAAPPSPIVGLHAVGNAGTPEQTVGGTGQPTTQAAREYRIGELKEILRRHKNGGMTEENMKLTSSYKELQRLQAAG